MLSQEKLLEAVNIRIAELLAEQVYAKLKQDMAEERNTLLSELAYTRKTSEHLKEALTQSENMNVRFEQLLNAKETELQANRELQKKSAKVIDEAVKMLAGE